MLTQLQIKINELLILYSRIIFEDNKESLVDELNKQRDDIMACIDKTNQIEELNIEEILIKAKEKIKSNKEFINKM
ncbi:hypothetical protein A0H76_568 [Hepatospora eriocheir]|uniref:Uncharacterized protein n=1 Tax=Hepatospora eriocheir TaxID=1081669 RepID=A0A1X0QIK1_9MICR|nr:hypothetical protein A0H76_568 [Hepatospora eriocheir]